MTTAVGRAGRMENEPMRTRDRPFTVSPVVNLLLKSCE